MSSDRLVPDAIWAALTIWAEARSESFEGQVAVANVIRNRMKRRYSSDGTVPGTCLRDRQFSCWNHNDGQRIRVAKVGWDDGQIISAMWAWQDSAERSIVGNAVLYHTVQNPGRDQWPPPWATAPGVLQVRRVGAHIFYEDGGAHA